MLVLADANVARAVRGSAWAAFANAGQCGGSLERVLCVPEVHDRFLAGVVQAARGLRVGDPSDPSTSIGPLVDRERVARSGRWSTRPSVPARPCTAAARMARPTTPRRCSAE